MVSLYAQWILHRRYVVILAALALVVCAAIGLGHLHFKNDYRMFFSEENPQLTAFEQMQNVYTRNENVLIVVAPRNGDLFTAENLGLVEKITALAWQIPYSFRVDSLTNFQFSESSGDLLKVGDLVRDAASLSQLEIDRIRNIALNEPLLVDRLISRSGRVTGINVIVQRPGLNQLDETNQVNDYVHRVIRDQVMAERPDVEIYLTGTVMMDAAFASASEHDASTLTPLMSLIIIVTLLWFLRSFAGMLIVTTIVTLSIIAALGIAGWIGIALSPSSVPAPTILLTVAVAYSVHLLVSYYDGIHKGMERSESMVASLKLNFSALFFTSLTTAISFLSMNFSDAPPFRDLGNITAIGVVTAFLLSATLLPALTVLFPVKKPRTATHSSNRLNGLAELIIRHHNKWVLLAVGLSVFLISCIGKNEFNDEFVKYFAPGTEFRDATDFTTESLTGVYYLDYSLESGESGGAADPKYLADVEGFANWLRQQPEVLHVFSITDIFKRLNKNLHGDDPAWYTLPETRETASQYLFLYEMSLPFGLDLNDRINVDKSSARLTATLKSLSTNGVFALESRAQSWLKSNAPDLLLSEGTGLTMMFAHIGARNTISMISGVLLSFSLISLLLMFVFRSVPMGLLSLVPNLLPAIMAFGLWGLIVGRVGLASSVVAAMTLGILVDDTVHFLSKYLHARRNEKRSTEDALRYAFSTVGRAIWVTSAVLVSGFALLAFSDFKINADMGFLCAMIFALGLYAEFFLLPPLLLLLNDIRQHLHGYFGKSAPHTLAGTSKE